MANSDPEDVLVVARDGITVEKSFEPDDFPVPAIAFVFRSDRDEPVSVRLVDSVPEDISPENIGFHPNYGAEFWGVVDDGIVFERELAPGEEYTTVYGLRGDDTDVPSKFLSDPTIESVTPSLDGEGGSETGDGAGDDVDIEADRDTEDGGGDTNVGVDPDPETADSAGNNGNTDTDSGSAAAEDATGATGDDEDGGADEPAGSDRNADPADGEPDSASVVDELLAELEGADPDDPEIVALREALGVGPAGAAVEARIEHLQSAVADLEAYTDAFEAFLDENGDAQQILDDINEQYERTHARLDDIEATAEAANESARSTETRLDDEFGDVREEIDALESEIESLSEELSEVVEMRKRLTEALGGIAGGNMPDED